MNSIFTFTKTLTTDKQEFVNFNKLIIVPPSVFTTTKYFYYISAPDDTRLDILSVQEYNTNLYADLIFLINKMTSVFDLPRNISFVEETIDTDYNKYVAPLNITNTSQLTFIRRNIARKYYRKNELYRNLRMVKPDYIKEVIEVIKNANSI